ncbi:unnamed protein product [Urochloa decumbens]|uniref:Uncharacterized protein n=1 Tax=Urochloa decumbens TaxID=240449 RepID=A0ABC9DSV0_9POAL
MSTNEDTLLAAPPPPSPPPPPPAEEPELEEPPRTRAPAAAMPAPAAAPLPYQRMLGSTAYERMRAGHPAEFAPASVFFTHDPRSAIDRRNSFRVKAALVYEAVTGHHVDDHMTLASSFLLALAKECHSRIIQKLSGDAAGERDAPDAENASTPSPDPDTPDNKGGNKPSSEPTDEGWDEKRKRVVDAIFLVVGFLPKLKEAIAKSSDRDGVDDSFKSQHMQDIVTDVIKLENQLPLRDLLDVAAFVEAAVNATVGRDEFKDVTVAGAGAGGEYKLPFAVDGFGDVLHSFCWYYSPFASSKRPAASPSPFKDVAADEATAARTTLLDCLHMSLVRPPPAQQGSAGAGGAATGGRPSRMPTARELRRSGVRIQASESGRAEVEFAAPAARLPALVFDFKLATVARNLLAREYEEERSKPVTRYFQMVNELVEDAADVRVLRRAGVVRGGGSGGDQEVLALVKGIDGHATYPSVYMAMDREIEKVRKYHDQRMKSFFVRNRPGVIWASSVAAISVVAIVAARRNRG